MGSFTKIALAFYGKGPMVLVGEKTDELEVADHGRL